MSFLDLLFELLVEGKSKEYLDMFRRRSSLNHSETFRIATSRRYRVRRVGDYILISCDSIGLFVIGLDENDRLFCHNLPQNVYWSEVLRFSEKDVRNLMGFDVHFWEGKIMDNLRIRLQGDITVNVIRTFGSIGDLENYLILLLDHMIVLPILHLIDGRFYDDLITKSRNMDLVFPNRGELYGFVENMLADSLRSFTRELKIIRIIPILDLISVAYLLGADVGSSIDLGIEELRDILNKVREKIDHIVPRISGYERRYRIRIDRHIIKLIGTRLDFNINITKSYGENMYLQLPSRTWYGNPSTFVLLRPQYIVSMHPEHGTTSLYFPRSIIRLGTLRHGNYQIRYGERLEADRQIRVRIPQSFLRTMEELWDSEVHIGSNITTRNAILYLILSMSPYSLGIENKNEMIIMLLKILENITINTHFTPIGLLNTKPNIRRVQIRIGNIKLVTEMERKTNPQTQRAEAQIKIVTTELSEL